MEASGIGGQADERQHLLGAADGLAFRVSRLHPEVRGDGDVFQDGQLAEGAGDLEGPGDAPVAHGIRGEAPDFPVLEANRAGRRHERAGHAVEARRLARAIGADEPEDLPLLHGEGDSVEGGEAAEPLGQAIDGEHGRAGGAGDMIGRGGVGPPRPASGPISERPRATRRAGARARSAWR